MDILFAPKIKASYELGECRIDPNNPDGIICDVIMTCQMPDPRQCVILKNVDWNAGPPGAGRA